MSKRVRKCRLDKVGRAEKSEGVVRVAWTWVGEPGRVRTSAGGVRGSSEWYSTEHSVDSTSYKPSKRRTKPAGARSAVIEKRKRLARRGREDCCSTLGMRLGRRLSTTAGSSDGDERAAGTVGGSPDAGRVRRQPSSDGILR